MAPGAVTMAGRFSGVFDFSTGPSLLVLAAFITGTGLVAAGLLGMLGARLGRRLDRLGRLVERERSGKEMLRHIAYHDALTGLGNRHAFNVDATMLGVQGRGEENRAAVVLVDLDDFKLINDTYGHQVGDEVLLTMTRRLGRYCTGRGRVYRLGGDEFVLLWQGAPDAAAMEAFVGGMAEAVFSPIVSGGREIAISGSIGISKLEPEETDLGAALRRADLALYEAKEQSGVSFSFYRGRSDPREALRREVEALVQEMVGDAPYRTDRYGDRGEAFAETARAAPALAVPAKGQDRTGRQRTRQSPRRVA